MALTNETGTILRNEQVGPNLYVMEVESPDIAGRVAPGQFVHTRLPGMEGHILRRPFSVYTADAVTGRMEILYQVVGFGSDHMTTLVPGQQVENIGPVGHGWTLPEDARRVLIVGGGVGAAPVYLLAKQAVEAGREVDVVLGARTKDALVCLARYEALGARSVRCATDDGTFGHAGFCTGVVEELLAAGEYDYAAVCGPEPLMKIVAQQTANASLPCQVSLERRMACGVGACLSCVVDTVDGKKRSCVDGPVFDAEKVVW